MLLQKRQKSSGCYRSVKGSGKQLPTVFEAETAIAFLYYKRMKCDFVVLESGLGGMEDATNVVKIQSAPCFRRSVWITSV